MKTALITGANSGIGLATAKGLASSGFNLLLIVRSKEKGESTKKEIQLINPNTKIDFEIADLEDVKSVKIATDNIKRRYTKIERIINNAGYSPNSIGFTKDGFEKSFAANHLGHFSLTLNLLELVIASGEGRVINVSSSAYTFGDINRMFLKNNVDLTTMKAYGDAKLANILFTKSLLSITNEQSILSFSLHPGVVASNFGKNFTGINKLFMKLMKPFMISPEKGASTSLFLATTALDNIKKYNGEHFEKSKVAAIKKHTITQKDLDWFWNKSMEAISEN